MTTRHATRTILSDDAVRGQARAWDMCEDRAHVSADASPAKPQRLAFLPLLALALSIVAIANDFTALNVTVPALEDDYDINVGTAQWVINAYVLVFAMLIVPGGRLVDIF